MATAVSDAVLQRRSCRAFLKDAPPAAAVAHLLERASRAPSGANMQPWRCYVLAGGERQRLVDTVMERLEAGVIPEDSPGMCRYCSCSAQSS